MKMKRLILGALSLVLLTSLAACGGTGGGSTESKAQTESKVQKKIVIGAGPLTLDIVNAIIPIMKEKGYDVEMKAFEDFIMPNVALGEGSIDANIYQHVPYLTAYNEKNGTDFVSAYPVGVNLNGVFSNKHATFSDFPQGAKIGIHTDAANQDKYLRILERGKALTLTEKADGLYTIFDVADNPKNLEFVTLDIAQMPPSINDLDAVCSSKLTMGQAKVTPKYTIFEETVDDAMEYATTVVVQKDNTDAEWLEPLKEAYKDPRAVEFVQKSYNGAWTLLK